MAIQSTTRWERWFVARVSEDGITVKLSGEKLLAFDTCLLWTSATGQIFHLFSYLYWPLFVVLFLYLPLITCLGLRSRMNVSRFHVKRRAGWS